MTFPKTLQHTSNYLVNIQVFGDKVLESDPAELNYVATSFDIHYSGGSDFIHQKGRNVASAFAMQPTVSINIRCYMTEPDFSVLVSTIIANQQHILMTVGKLKKRVKVSNIKGTTILDSSATIYEIVGYMRDARITATAGEFITVEFTVNADDVEEINYNDLPTFNEP